MRRKKAGLSGAYGDEQWRYALAGGAALAGDLGEEPCVGLQEAARKVTVKYRVRFEVETPEQSSEQL